MNFEMTAHAAIKDSGYQIKTIENCRIVTGSVPISDYAALCEGYSERAVMAIDIANRIGATLVIGEPEDIERLRQFPLPVSEARMRDAELGRGAGLPPPVFQWLLEGERGRSSDAICKAFYGIPEHAGIDHPLDPDDLRRCLLFIKTAEDHNARIGELKGLSPQWLALVSEWPRLVDCFERETADLNFNRAPQTYAIMQRLLN
jgi:hypothetical protein